MVAQPVVPATWEAEVTAWVTQQEPGSKTKVKAV
jgi:hypothetical protein